MVAELYSKSNLQFIKRNEIKARARTVRSPPVLWGAAVFEQHFCSFSAYTRLIAQGICITLTRLSCRRERVTDYRILFEVTQLDYKMVNHICKISERLASAVHFHFLCFRKIICCVLFNVYSFTGNTKKISSSGWNPIYLKWMNFLNQ